MERPLVTLTTDFGEGSTYTAQMKGAVLRVEPAAVLIDITHSIGPQDVHHAALVLDEVALRFPPDTIHVCVVDPGVGTQRKIVYARCGGQHFVAPDNGVLSLLARRAPVARLIRIESREFWQANVSATFHGRDIMAPVAGHLCRGVAPERLGSAHRRLVDLDWPEVQREGQALRGVVLLVDHFGNLITNITRSMLPRREDGRQLVVTCRDRSCDDWVDTYGERPAGTLVALVGSSDRLEIAICQGHAARKLGAVAGDPVRVDWSRPTA